MRVYLLFAFCLGLVSPALAVTTVRQIKTVKVQATVTFYDEASADAEFSKTASGQEKIRQRHEYTKTLNEKLGYDVMLITVVVKNDQSSKQPLKLTCHNFYCFQRRGQCILSIGLVDTLSVARGQSGHTYVAFRRMALEPHDHFCILSGDLGE